MPQIEREAGIQNKRVTESKRVVMQKVGESERERLHNCGESLHSKCMNLQVR